MKMEWKVTLGLAFAVLMQLAGTLVWAGAAAERLDALERTAVETRPIGERLVRVEAELEAMRAQLTRIETKLEQLQ